MPFLTKEQLSDELKQKLLNRIDEILFYKFDPIGIWDYPSLGIRTEYRGCTYKVLDIAIENKCYQPLEDHLNYLANDHFHMPVATEVTSKLAKLIFLLVHQDLDEEVDFEYEMESGMKTIYID